MRRGGLYLFIFGLLLIILSSVFTVNLFFKTKTDLLEAEPIEKKSFERPQTDSGYTWTRFMSEKKIVKDYTANELFMRLFFPGISSKRTSLRIPSIRWPLKTWTSTSISASSRSSTAIISGEASRRSTTPTA